MSTLKERLAIASQVAEAMETDVSELGHGAG